MVTKMDKDGMAFSLEVYTKPEVKLGRYKELEITEVPSALTDEEIDQAIRSEAEKNARMVTVEDRPLKRATRSRSILKDLSTEMRLTAEKARISS